MSTDHNRIKVADLEKNEQNKTLITNSKGELEFRDFPNVKAESYNALDYTVEGKALDARQGKVLKDLIDSKQVDLATDTETQITTSVTEDKKVVSRLKLFNWWQWVKSQAQTVSGIWNFTSKVTLASGNSTNPSLIMPNGALTTTPQNGAIERDQNGILWETHGGIRSQIITKDAISSDTYIAALDTSLGIKDASFLTANYTKIGNIVHVMVAITATPKALGSDAEIGISLPFNRNSSTNLLSGIAAGATASSNFSAQVYITNSANASIKYKVNVSGLSNIVANFSYDIS